MCGGDVLYGRHTGVHITLGVVSVLAQLCAAVQLAFALSVAIRGGDVIFVPGPCSRSNSYIVAAIVTIAAAALSIVASVLFSCVGFRRTTRSLYHCSIAVCPRDCY
eukprot:TRINITY_DN3341_c0_g1_i1.p1 TRINITY_DN3341_c0_g1~~TRINITY_DN3341_c0_g1_i1.p1  ORF type:complete len:106 (+),score=7.74 TRINITY_DN3341_c0_g1_i1:417-734(+)